MFDSQIHKIAQSYLILGLGQVVHSMEETLTQLYNRLCCQICSLEN